MLGCKRRRWDGSAAGCYGGAVPEIDPYRLLFVCTGNICRSPMAAALARAYATKRGWAVEVASAGVLDLKGRPAEPNAIRVMEEIGIDLRTHQARGVNEELVRWADYILAMELAHCTELRRRYPEIEDRVLLLGSFGGSLEIADPMGGWRWRFRRTRDEIRHCVEGFLDQLPTRPG